MSKLYEVDPEADVLLIVPDLTEPFAPWDPVPPKPAPAASTSSPYASLFSNRLLVHSGLTRKTVAPAAPETGLRIKVSSRHLSLASATLKSRLQFADAPNEADGRVHLRLEGVDPTAVKIVLDAVHGRGRRVPKSVDVETLAKIAVFVDRFQLQEAVEVYADRWIGQLERSLPATYNRDLILWIYITYVFRQGDLFKAASKVAITQSTEPIRNLGLPIREKITKTIDSERQQAVGQSLAAITTVVEDLRDGNGVASYPPGYETFLLGSLFKHPSRLLWPQPAKPFLGTSYATIVSTIQEVNESAVRHSTARAIPSYGLAKKRKVPHFPEAPPSPESSPEPVARHGLLAEPDEGPAPDIFGAALEKLGAEVKGLDLESSLGYYLY